MNKKLWIILLCVIVFVTGCIRRNTKEQQDAILEAERKNSQAIDKAITYKDEHYTYNKHLVNILFLGIDKTDLIQYEDLPGEGGQSDCMILMTLNKETKEVRMLQINRNTMIEIDYYNKGGSVAMQYPGQICLQYGCGTGTKTSVWSTKKKVQELLYGLPIDGYVVMDLSGIARINDAFGGVDLLMTEDYSEIDSVMKKGATIHLEGELAERFVRYRDVNEFNSVEDRMHRQVTYLHAWADAMKSGINIYETLMPFLNDCIFTDLSETQIVEWSGYAYHDDVLYLPGETVMGEKYEEFYVDEEALQDLIIQNYYIKL